eukprot:446911-Rhodomonas_salina.2
MNRGVFRVLPKSAASVEDFLVKKPGYPGTRDTPGTRVRRKQILFVLLLLVVLVLPLRRWTGIVMDPPAGTGYPSTRYRVPGVPGYPSLRLRQ